MSLQYKIMSTYKLGQGKKGEKIYFPKLTGTSQVNLLDVAHILAERSTASEADVYLITMGFVGHLPELFAQGKTIKLERYWFFQVACKGKNRIRRLKGSPKTYQRNTSEF